MPAMSKIKICGLFRPEDIETVNEARPDYIGFVLAKSRRQVTLDEAQKLRKRLDTGIIPVGVFVNAPIEEIQRAFDAGVIEAAQLHGQEDEAYIRSLRRICPVPIIKAIEVVSPDVITPWQSSEANFLLLDNGKGTCSTGGTGKAFDWSLIPAMQKLYFLAGGIRLSNVDAALTKKPYCIDISSGAETDGVKDRAKICRLVRRVREGF